MSGPAFGFSAGDFIAAATLIKTATRAFKDAGGARADYQALVSELNLLQQVLASFRDDDDSQAVGNPFHTFAKQQTYLSITQLSEFLETISKFSTSLGADSASGQRRSPQRKAQWAVQYTSKVEKLRITLGSQLQTIILALCLEQRSTRQLEPSTVGPTGTADIPLGVLGSMKGSLLTEVDALSQSLKKMKAEQEFSAQNLQANLHRFGHQLDNLLSKSARISPSSPLTYPDMTSTPSLNRTIGVGVVQQEYEVPAVYSNGLAFNLRATDSPNSSIYNRSKVLQSGGATHATEDQSILRLVILLLRAIAKETRILLLVLCAGFPHFVRFFRLISCGLFREPMLAIADSINFEDVLGRKFTLHHDFYSHWPNFEAFLSRQFKEAPGQYHITMGEYKLLSDTNAIGSFTWTRQVTRGMTISMSVIVPEETRFSQRSCPKPDCPGSGQASGTSSEKRCSICGLIYQKSSERGKYQIRPLRYSEYGFYEATEMTEHRLGADLEVFRRIHIRPDRGLSMTLDKMEAVASCNESCFGPYRGLYRSGYGHKLRSNHDLEESLRSSLRSNIAQTRQTGLDMSTFLSMKMCLTGMGVGCGERYWMCHECGYSPQKCSSLQHCQGCGHIRCRFCGVSS